MQRAVLAAVHLLQLVLAGQAENKNTIISDLFNCGHQTGGITFRVFLEVHVVSVLEVVVQILVVCLKADPDIQNRNILM